MLIFLTTRFIKCNQDDIDDIDLQIRMNEGTYNYSPFSWWNINLFDFADEINFEARDNGILLKNNGHIKATITPYCYLLDKNGFPTAPMLLAFVLAPMLEKNMRKAFIASQGSLRIFVDSPLKLVLLAVFLVLVLTPVVKSIRRKLQAKKAQA